MRLSYKLKDCRHVKFFEHDVLSADAGKNPYFKERKVEMSFFDDDNHRIGNRRFVMLCKDLDNGHYYFVIDGQKIYVSEYEYLEIEDLISKIQNGEYVSLDIFVSSLIKNADKIAFIEQRWVPDLIFPALGVRSYSGDYKFKNVICVPIEENYDREHWSYKIETVPVNDEEKLIYGKDNHYICDYFSSITNGYVRIIPRSDIEKYDFSHEEPFTRKRKKV